MNGCTAAQAEGIRALGDRPAALPRDYGMHLTEPDCATTWLPLLGVLHHILVRARILLLQALHSWQGVEGVRCVLVEEHSEEALTSVEGGFAHEAKTCEEECHGVRSHARTVLGNAKMTGQ